MTLVAFIFARGGSKGLPGKNIRPLAGKPLIAWSIECALEINRIDRVIVSTDSKEIADVAKQYGAEVPFLRPYDLSQDDTPEWLAWQHAINFLSVNSDEHSEAIVSIPATAPLRMPIDIENCLDEYERGGADVVISVTDAHRNPYFNMVKINSDNNYGLVCPLPSGVYRRQDAPIVYDMTTVCYVANMKFVMSNNGIFDGRIKAVHVPLERAIDIDTILDFEIAETIMKKRNRLV